MQLAYDRCGYDIFAGLLFKQGNSQRNEKQQLWKEMKSHPTHPTPPFKERQALKDLWHS